MLLSAFFLLGVVGALWQRQAIYDWWRLKDYQPSAAIQSLATATTMNDHGRHMFYVYHPALEDKAAFNLHCSGNEKTVVLGCYITNQGIYIFDVTDPRLSGIEEVTAAHEMLHAAYDRLARDERTRVDNLTAQAFSGLTDERVRDTVERYRTRDPSVVPNELHSILATEVKDLPSELEQYYKRYFTNRQAIVAFSAQYQQAFTERQNKIEQLDKQINDLRAQIDRLQSQLNSSSRELEQQRNQLDALRASKRFEEYNTRVPGFNEEVRAYNADVNKVRTLIDQYNQLVKDRNALAVEENELIKAIDSRPEAIPSE